MGVKDFRAHSYVHAVDTVLDTPRVRAHLINGFRNHLFPPDKKKKELK